MKVPQVFENEGTGEITVILEFEPIAGSIFVIRLFSPKGNKELYSITFYIGDAEMMVARWANEKAINDPGVVDNSIKIARDRLEAFLDSLSQRSIAPVYDHNVEEAAIIKQQQFNSPL